MFNSQSFFNRNIPRAQKTTDQNKFRQTQEGFTLIELLLAMGIAAVLFGISSILLSNIIPRANMHAVFEVLQAEIRQQQLNAMVGERDANNDNNHYGVLIEESQYVLFSGTNIDPLPSDAITIPVPNTIQLSTNFPNNVIIFERLSGEIINYDSSARTISVTDTLTHESKSLRFNAYGVPE